MNNSSLADHIFAKRVPQAEAAWIADVLGRLVWLTADNGAEICQALRQWLTSEIKEKIVVALAFDEVFLWNSEAEMEELLSAIEARFPDLSPMCTAAKSRWKAQFGGEESPCIFPKTTRESEI